jgi:hypothetical protein
MYDYELNYVNNISTAGQIHSIHFDIETNGLYLVDLNGKQVFRYSHSNDREFSLNLTINVSHSGSPSSLIKKYEMIYVGIREGFINSYDMGGNLIASHILSNRFTYFWSIQFDAFGNFIYADELNHEVCQLSPIGKKFCIKNFLNPVSLCIDTKNNILVGFLWGGFNIYSA